MKKKILKTIASEVEKFPDKHVEQLNKLNSAWKEVKAALRETFKGDKVMDSDTLRATLAELKNSFNKVDETKPKLKTILEDGCVDAKKQCDRHTLMLIQADFSKTPHIPVLRLDKLSSRYTADVKRDIRIQLGVGVVRKETIQQMAARIAPKIAKTVPPGNAVGKALTQKYNYWAERIVRTELNRQYNVEQIDVVKELKQNDPQIKMMWQAIIDGKTCSICGGLNMYVADIGQSFNGYDAPPLHPNCHCSIIPYKDDWEF